MKKKIVKKSASAAKSASKPLTKLAAKPLAKAKSAVTNKGKSSAKSAAKPDIVDLILQDHKPIKELLMILKDSEVEAGCWLQPQC